MFVRNGYEFKGHHCFLFLAEQGQQISRLVLDSTDSITNQKPSSPSDRPCAELCLLPS
jgi:hypothetical protein